MKKTPEHVAVIMDGNGRWAVSRGKIRIEGHRAGAGKVLEVVDWCMEYGVPYLTLYAFSTENWNRPAEEVEGLLKLMGLLLRTKTGMFAKKTSG